ncbi:MAG: DUF2283 domain-containing protein [Saprospiraceae bacterium]|nr:DUF2283 domain-containing protein [Saprospiraceae bacterium]
MKVKYDKETDILYIKLSGGYRSRMDESSSKHHTGITLRKIY